MRTPYRAAACCDTHSWPESLPSHTYVGAAPGLAGATGSIVFIQSLVLLGLLPMPLRTIVKPAPAVALNSRSTSAARCASGSATMPLARWNASLNPKPSIVWYVVPASTVMATPTARPRPARPARPARGSSQ